MQSPRHFNGALDVTLLRRLVAAQQKQIDHLTATGEIGSVAGAEMNSHFGNPFAHGLAVTEVAMFGRADAMRYAGTTELVFQSREPSVKLVGAEKGVHVPKCIRSDTDMQSANAVATCPASSINRHGGKCSNHAAQP